MTKAAKKKTVVNDLSGAIDDVVEQAERVLNRGWKAAFEVLPDRAEEIVDDLAKQSRKVQKDLDKRRKQVVKDVERAISRLDKRRDAFAKRAEKQIDQLFGSVEQSVSDIVRPVAKRLDIASNSDVTSLKRRLTQIEKAVGTKTTRRRTRKTAARAA
jgi:polyhydroxyalkanoate synthesis regulator phasin